jgi:hypothetical protein
MNYRFGHQICGQSYGVGGKWEKKQFAKAAAAKKGVSQNMGEELLIMNY